MLCRALPYTLKYHGASDIGQVRARNEDVWNALEAFNFYVIADGMGGHNAGDVAAREAVRWCSETFVRVLGPEGQERSSLEEVLAVLRFVVKDVNKHVYRMAQTDVGLNGMGTTLCCCFFLGDSVLYGHVGDSRIYRWRDGMLRRLTRDHSLVRWMVDLNGLSEEAALRVVSRHVLTKAIGIDPYIDPSLDMTRVRPGDVYLMCTDGLTDVVPDSEIAEHVAGVTDPESANMVLMELVQKRGAPDNTTMLTVCIEEN